MLKKFASDALGLSDIGKIIHPADYDKTESCDYIFDEQGEVIHFLIKSKSDEYCFTNLAFIHLSGVSAVSKKRSLRRYNYFDHSFNNVWLETAGTVDLDVEIKFTIDDQHFSLDIDKKQLNGLKVLYRALYGVSSTQRENRTYQLYSQNALDTTASAFSRDVSDGSLKEQFEALNQYIFDWKIKCHKVYCRKDFGEIFQAAYGAPVQAAPPNLPQA